MSTLNKIKKLIKIANDYDTFGDHKSADKVDALIVSAFNKLGDEKVSGIITADEQKVEGDPKAKLDRLKTGKPRVDEIFKDTGTADTGTDLSNFSLGPRVPEKELQGGTQNETTAAPMPVEKKEKVKEKLVKEVAKKKKKGETGAMTDEEIDKMLADFDMTQEEIDEVLSTPNFLKGIKVPYAQTEVNNLTKSIKGKSIGWATVDDIMLFGDKVTSVSLTLKSGKKVKYTPKTKTKAGQSALALTVGDINKKLKKQLKV